MRAEDKQLEIDVERDELRARDAVAPEELREEVAEEALVEEVSPAIEAAVVEPAIVEEIRDEHRELVLAAIASLFEGESIQISELGLPARELAALASLQAAITGRESLGRFVFADDRRDLLEHALGVLQPSLGAIEDVAKIDGLTSRVAELRSTLDGLSEAQEEIPEWEKDDWFGEHGKPAGDKDDDDDDKPDPDAEAPAKGDHVSTLDGPEVVAEAKPSTLDGPERPAEPARPSILDDVDLSQHPPIPRAIEREPDERPPSKPEPGKQAKPGKPGKDKGKRG